MYHSELTVFWCSKTAAAITTCFIEIMERPFLFACFVHGEIRADILIIKAAYSPKASFTLSQTTLSESEREFAYNDRFDSWSNTYFSLVLYICDVLDCAHKLFDDSLWVIAFGDRLIFTSSSKLPIGHQVLISAKKCTWTSRIRLYFIFCGLLPQLFPECNKRVFYRLPDLWDFLSELFFGTFSTHSQWNLGQVIVQVIYKP